MPVEGVEDFIIPEGLQQSFRSCHPFCLAILVFTPSGALQILAMGEERINLFPLQVFFLYRELLS